MQHPRLVLGLVFCLTAAISYGQTPEKSVKPDNTKTNERDRNAGEDTADQQKMNAEDEKLTREIRRSIMEDKSLSTYAHNVKIISRDGAVTVKGPVKSADEKKKVIAKAVAVAGNADKVTDQVTVAEDKK
jgi:hyperosmotically inducible protein